MGSVVVLDSARTGLIFTRSQEGTQLGELTQTGQTELGIRYHELPCWVPVGELDRGKSVAAWERVGHRAVRAALCILLFVLYILLSILLLLLFVSFAVLLNCPYPDP